MKRARRHEDELRKQLKDPKAVARYLKLAYEDSDKRVFLLAVKDVIDAQGSVTSIARQAHLDRRHLYVMLSKNGNPEWFSLNRLFDVLGIRISFEVKADKPSKLAA